MTYIATRVLLAFLFVIAPSPALMAQTFDDDTHKHIRTTDQRLARLLDEGARGSQTFRRLVDRLRRSDVIVYLESGQATRAADGRLRFLSAAGGLRYVHISVARLASADAQIALIGHELRHAVEIADAPSIVDAESLAREYQRIGFLNARQLEHTSYDSDAAVAAGYQVLRDLTGRAGSVSSMPDLHLPAGAY